MDDQWQVTWRDDALYITHEHDGQPLKADLHTDVNGYRRAQCSKIECQAIFPISREVEEEARTRG